MRYPSSGCSMVNSVHRARSNRPYTSDQPVIPGITTSPWHRTCSHMRPAYGAARRAELKELMAMHIQNTRDTHALHEDEAGVPVTSHDGHIVVVWKPYNIQSLIVAVRDMQIRH